MLVRRNLAWVRLASPSMFMVPMKLVLIVLMGLYLQIAAHNTQTLLRLDMRVWDSKVSRQHHTCMPVYPAILLHLQQLCKDEHKQLCGEPQVSAARCTSVYASVCAN